MTETPKGSLYSRLGGYDSMVGVLERVCARMLGDEKLGVYFKGHSDQSKKRLSLMFISYICEAAGGPLHTGSDLRTSHQGLGISGAEWDIMVKYIRQAIGKAKFDQGGAEELVSLIEGLKDQVVEC